MTFQCQIKAKMTVHLLSETFQEHWMLGDGSMEIRHRWHTV